MELIKDVIKVDNRIDFGKFQTFIETEAVVPDKKSDVYDIVKTEGYISIKKIEVADGKLVCRGSFNYNVIYITDDKNTVSSVDGKIDINEVIEKDNIVQDMEYMLYPEVEHVDCTIMNERKIRVGALMNIRGSLFDKQKLDIVKDVSQVEGIQKHRKEISYQDIIGIEKSESVIRDTITINTEEIQSIISLNPYAKIKESRVADNKVIIGGVLEVNPLACTYDGELVELDRIGIDFTQFIEVPGACDGMSEESLLSMGDFNYIFKQNGESNTGLLEIDCTVACKVKVSDEVTREVLQDAYSPQKIIKFDHRAIEVNKTLSNGSETFVVRDSIKNANDDIQIKDVVSVCPTISIENSYVEDDKSVIQGIIKVDILYVPVEGLRIVYKLSEEIPFEHETTIDNLTDTCKVFSTAAIEKVDVDLNRDEIDLSVKVKRYTEAVDKKPESFIIKGDDLGVYDLSKAPSIIVYICKEGDNLWNIAKKYNTTENEIAEINELRVDEPLKPGKCLILEKKVVLVD
ncbi:DUF3794 and LysM peptidoglycan-binding domain-containing protein [Romboutsia lituseburensis]|uniref:LysM domain-containing protein n=1 Tax=Romboutsia lituseburensis DSM 797 TaxID=1121325 RepID=A0A1G9SY30_9FIRM|nr:SPOCS domain-containing protein [Romboutsia lituseburensis]CEH35966.1 LysM domain protein [Romboutsia lituseburensis]SDM40341.1 protein of unknown function [Romboutsia lituseburensis DSM 797]